MRTRDLVTKVDEDAPALLFGRNYRTSFESTEDTEAATESCRCNVSVLEGSHSTPRIVWPMVCALQLAGSHSDKKHIHINSQKKPHYYFRKGG